jgi:drug/metabolite transporter (DMT)-like permease
MPPVISHAFKRKRTLVKIILPLGYAMFWGVGVTLSKLALSEIGETTLLIIQMFSSVVFLSAICYAKERQLPFSWRHLRQGIAGIFEPALAYMVGIFGLQMTTVSNATLIASSEVTLTIVFAAIFLGERLTWMKAGLSGISFVGVALLMMADTGGAGRASWAGDLLILLGTVFAVCYVLFSKKQVGTLSPLQLTASQQMVGLITTVGCFGLFAIANPNYEITAAGISLPFWGLAIASGILQYALAFLFYLIALQNVPVSHAAFYVALIPVFGVTSAVVILGENPDLSQWAGGFLVIISSYLASQLKSE